MIIEQPAPIPQIFPWDGAHLSIYIIVVVIVGNVFL
jgi:hypothetical protein